MTPALIRCAGKTPEQSIDIMVQSDGAITSLGECLSSLCRDIRWGHHSMGFLLDSDPEKRVRIGTEENLGSLVFGMLWPHFDSVETINFIGGTFSRRYSHNQFVIGPVDNKNLERAYYVYHIEFRDIPGDYQEYEVCKGVWINITNDQLETQIEGWADDVFSIIEAKIAECDQDD